MCDPLPVRQVVVTQYGLSAEYLSVSDCIQRIGTTTDTLEFHTLLTQAYCFLDVLSVGVKSKRDPFGKILPTAVLGLIFEFLTSKEILTIERTCKTWHSALLSVSRVWKLLILQEDFHFLASSITTITNFPIRFHMKKELELENNWKFFLKKESIFYQRHKILTIDLKEETNELLTAGTGDVSGGVALLWNLKTGSRLQQFTYPFGHDINSAKIGENCIIGAGGTYIHVFDKKQPAHYYRVGQHQLGISSIELLGNHLISASADSTLKLWNFETSTMISHYKDHKFSIHSLCIHNNNNNNSGSNPDGDIFYSGSADKFIKIWDTRIKECIKTISGQLDTINVLNCDGNTLCSGSWDGSIYLWDTRMLHSKNIVWASDVSKPFIGVYIRGRRLVNSCQNEIRVWNGIRQMCQKNIPNNDSLRAFYCNSHYCIVGGDKGEVYFYDFKIKNKKISKEEEEEKKKENKNHKECRRFYPSMEKSKELDLEVQRHPFYKFGCSRAFAEHLLDAGPWDCFVVRDCSDKFNGVSDPNLFVLSVKFKKFISHHKIWRYPIHTTEFPMGFGFHPTRSNGEKIYPSIWALVYDTIGFHATIASI